MKNVFFIHWSFLEKEDNPAYLSLEFTNAHNHLFPHRCSLKFIVIKLLQEYSVW